MPTHLAAASKKSIGSHKMLWSRLEAVMLQFCAAASSLLNAVGTDHKKQPSSCFAWHCFLNWLLIACQNEVTKKKYNKETQLTKQKNNSLYLRDSIGL